MAQNKKEKPTEVEKREKLMNTSVKKLIDKIIEQDKTIEKLRAEKDKLRKVSASDKVREENRTLKAKVKKYEDIISKFASVNVKKEDKKEEK